MIHSRGGDANQTIAELKLRRFLVGVAAFVCGATIVELLLTEHTTSWVQLLPIWACVLGIVASLALLRVATPLTIKVHRSAMMILLAISLAGVYNHIVENYLFAREIRPTSTATDALVEALTGASPLMAPGILALAGILGLVGTLRYSALPSRRATGEPSASGYPPRDISSGRGAP